ncbi:MAG: hypothetical protein JWO03_1968 [Bacteroidetes bacterium]|nr:hypothetical protein [Bacteroidota bacterium]
MKQLLLAAALFLASDAAFAHSSVLSGNNNGSQGLIRRPSPVVVEPARPAPSPDVHKVTTKPGSNDSFKEFLYRLYRSLMK